MFTSCCAYIIFMLKYENIYIYIYFILLYECLNNIIQLIYINYLFIYIYYVFMYFLYIKQYIYWIKGDVCNMILIFSYYKYNILINILVYLVGRITMNYWEVDGS